MATDTATVTVAVQPLPQPVTDTATVTITVGCSIEANDDTATVEAPGVAIANVMTNDLLCEETPTQATATLTEASTVPPELSFDTSTGAVELLPDAEPGQYTFDYQLCSIEEPELCDVATVLVIYEPPVEQCPIPVCSCVSPC